MLITVFCQLPLFVAVDVREHDVLTGWKQWGSFGENWLPAIHRSVEDFTCEFHGEIFHFGETINEDSYDICKSDV